MHRVLKLAMMTALTGCFDVGLGEDPPPAVMESPPGPCAIMDVEGEAAAVDAVRDHLECRGHDPAALQVECGPRFEHWLLFYDHDTGTVGELRVNCEAYVDGALLAVRTATVGIARQIEVLPSRTGRTPRCPGDGREECSYLQLTAFDGQVFTDLQTPEDAAALRRALLTCRECDLAGVTIDCWGPVRVEEEQQEEPNGWLQQHCRTHYPDGTQSHSNLPFDTY
ncbi:MAG: hypothetical protein ACI9U2_004691 [Bradymonadia bacterium]|jgi:hypothetical protein